ncbi:MAG: tRNA (guanosine(37)-N1)-methyltransferase TrmD [Patescibacteria group bacterium]|nr:tRNA (guanosine(37)-N1)-methyltransferase TrmD [Patescibacteria group bacterium]
MKKKIIKFDAITIFPEAFSSYLNVSIIRRAIKNKLVSVKFHNLRKFAKDKRKKVDDRPYGGGPGMVLKTEPIVRAVLKAKSRSKKEKIVVVLFSPEGKQFNNNLSAKLSKYDRVIMICGHYEGVDRRVELVLKNLKIKIEKISVGPYVLTGGELAAMILIDSVSRKIPGVLGKEESLEEKRHGIGVETYTRPSTLKYKGKKYSVPKVLISGNHKKIEEWRAKNKKLTTHNSDARSELQQNCRSQQPAIKKPA